MNGLVIAGGNSTRMMHDKALICYKNEPQYQVVFNSISTFCENTFISLAKENNNIFLPKIIDVNKYHTIGPMAALLSAFEFARTNWLVMAIDYPLIEKSDIESLVLSFERLQKTSIFYNSDTNFFEPLIGIYTTDFLEKILKNFHKKQFSLQQILLENDVKKITCINNNILQSIDTSQQFNTIKSMIS